MLRPRGPLESFDLGFRLLRAWWPPLWRLGALVLLPAWAACVAAAWASGWHPAAALGPLLLGPALQAPFTLLTGKLLFTREAPLRGVLRELRERLLPLLGGLGVQLAGVIVSVLTCGMAALPALVGLLYVPECALLERVPPARMFRRSLRLSGGYTAGALVGVVGGWALTLWAGAVAEASGDALLGYVLQAQVDVPSAMDGLCGPWLLLGLLVSQPVWAIWRLLLYVDVRTRVEGWDLQVGLRAAGLKR